MSPSSVIASHYSSTWNHYYAHSKMFLDPAYPAVTQALRGTAQPLLDLGCGLGLLAFWLREHGFDAPIHGCDLDADKIATAQGIAHLHYANIQFTAADAAAEMPEHEGHVCILDMLQYLTAEQQIMMLRKAASRVPVGAHLLIRTGLKADNWRYRSGRAMDHFARKIGWISSPLVYYPTAEEIVSVLRDAGMEGDLKPLWGRTPFHNYFGSFTRRSDA
jgi:cyclopropane fatty-acyl-phospholipid synthase-like methyltransferase